MGRRAVAATLVSFLVFTSLLLANSALYSAENSSLGAAVLSATQVREHEYGQILVGLSEYGSLAKVQDYLQSNTLDCTSPQTYLDSLAGSEHGAGMVEGIGYAADASWSYDAAAAGSGAVTPFLSQFGGYVFGEINVFVITSIEENFEGALPSYSIQDVETLHLPVPLASTISLCLTILSDLRGALSSLPHCNSSEVDAAISVARSSYSVLDTFTVSASASPVASGCEVEYWVTTTLRGLEGVSGTFQWTVSGAGSFET
ncbi:MAG: hypothetical protein OK474_09800 [Thaumarchaeota archaeon]|nr:hypothetical protein [Nitrososphaerota archaeon]